MIAYHYHPETFAYLGSSLANPSPLEPGVWLYPAHSTPIPPPTYLETEVCLWSDDHWEVHPVPIPPPPPPPPVTPDFPSFLEAVRKPVADHFLNTLVSRDFALTMSLRDAFLQANFPDILKYWNEAIAAHPAALTATLDIEHEGQTRGDFARAKMVEYHIPVIINPDYTLSFQAP